MKLLVKNIARIVGIESTGRMRVCGAEMNTLDTLADAWLLADNGRFAAFGRMDELGDIAADEVVDAQGGMLFPSFCDSHTHLVYAGSREQEFLDKEAAGEFLETADVFGLAHYGTPVKPVVEHLERNIPVILEIDIQGARSVKQRAGELGIEVMTVFIAPPSFEELERRLIGRGTETPEQQAKRLETAKIELAAESEFDKVIVNNVVDEAADELWNLIATEFDL